MKRDALVPWLVGVAIIAVAFGAGVPLGWSNGAIGTISVVACMASALTRALMHDYSTHE